MSCRANIEYSGPDPDSHEEAAQELHQLVPGAVAHCQGAEDDGKVGVDSVHHHQQGDVDKKVGTKARLEMNQYIFKDVNVVKKKKFILTTFDDINN